MSGARFREADLSGVRMRGVLLIGADIDGVIGGLTVNGVEVAPLVEAELDRRHPERAQLRPTTPEGMRAAWAVVESFWGDTMRRVEAMPEADLYRSVDDEWSYVQTLRHLVFVTDAWLGRAIEGRSAPFHPSGLPPSFVTGAASFGIDVGATPTYDEVVAARVDRVARVREYVASVTQAELDRLRDPDPGPGWPEPEARDATSCLHVIFDEEWTHHRFALRDLAALDS